MTSHLSRRSALKLAGAGLLVPPALTGAAAPAAGAADLGHGLVPWTPARLPVGANLFRDGSFLNWGAAPRVQLVEGDFRRQLFCSKQWWGQPHGNPAVRSKQNATASRNPGGGAALVIRGPGTFYVRQYVLRRLETLENRRLVLSADLTVRDTSMDARSTYPPFIGLATYASLKYRANIASRSTDTEYVNGRQTFLSTGSSLDANERIYGLPQFSGQPWTRSFYQQRFQVPRAIHPRNQAGWARDPKQEGLEIALLIVLPAKMVGVSLVVNQMHLAYC